jgi:uridylate kinase
MEEIIIISLGGSLIIPEELDVNFLKEFKTLILEQVVKGKKFVIITGGGKINRKYNDAARALSNPTDEDLDWVGIASLKLNAELVRVMFAEYANKKVVDNLSNHFSFEKSIIVGSAFEPGKSSDWDAIEAAKTVGAKKIVNLSNTDYVYDSDPKTNPNAQKIETISWQEYRKIIPAEWTSRLSTPFDPVASKIAEQGNIEVAIMNGKPIENLANYLNGEKFAGTVIS